MLPVRGTWLCHEEFWCRDGWRGVMLSGSNLVGDFCHGSGLPSSASPVLVLSFAGLAEKSCRMVTHFQARQACPLSSYRNYCRGCAVCSAHSRNSCLCITVVPHVAHSAPHTLAVFMVGCLHHRFTTTSASEGKKKGQLTHSKLE